MAGVKIQEVKVEMFFNRWNSFELFLLLLSALPACWCEQVSIAAAPEALSTFLAALLVGLALGVPLAGHCVKSNVEEANNKG